MIRFMQCFLRSEKGTTAIEYGLIAAIVVVLVIAAMQTLGQSVANALWAPIIQAF